MYQFMPISKLIKDNHSWTINYQCICHSGDSNEGGSVIPLVEIQMGVSTSGDADLLFIKVDVVTSALLYLRVEPWHDAT